MPRRLNGLATFGISRSIGNVRLDELGQKKERFLPPEVARFWRNNLRHAFLHDVQLGPDRYLLQRYRCLHFPWHVRVVKFVRVANALLRHQFEILASERMAASRGEICERHLISTADRSVQMMHLPGKTVWRKPFGHRIRVNKRSINFLSG